MYRTIEGKNKRRLQTRKEEIESTVTVSVTILETPQEVAAQSDLVITATPSSEPILQNSWVKNGLHITAMGADAQHKNEIDPNILKRANYYVADVMSQCEILGELRSAIEKGVVTKYHPVMELGDITSLAQKIRTSKNDITKVDLTGTSAQDTRTALYAYKKLTEET